jgi:hypothetical protein
MKGMRKNELCKKTSTVPKRPLLSERWGGQIKAMGLANRKLGTACENMKMITSSTQK